jgi:hypothetical protein
VVMFRKERVAVLVLPKLVSLHDTILIAIFENTGALSAVDVARVGASATTTSTLAFLVSTAPLQRIRLK